MNTKLILFFAFSICFKYSLSQNNGIFKFTVGGNYNYRDFNKPRYKLRYKNDTDTYRIAVKENFNKYQKVLDSIDVPIIAPALGFYFERKLDSIKSNGVIFRTGLQLGIKDYTLMAKKVYYYNHYKLITELVDSAILGVYQHPMLGIPITSGYKFTTKNNKFHISLSAGPVVNFWIGYTRFKTFKSQQKSIFNYYKPTRDLGYNDFKIADAESHLFFDANIRWQGQMALDYKISKNWMIGLFCWWEDTVFQRKNGGREFYRKGSEFKYTVTYRSRTYAGNISISLTRILK
jgi:hypothetical protein